MKWRLPTAGPNIPSAPPSIPAGRSISQNHQEECQTQIATAQAMAAAVNAKTIMQSGTSQKQPPCSSQVQLLGLSEWSMAGRAGGRFVPKNIIVSFRQFFVADKTAGQSEGSYA